MAIKILRKDVIAKLISTDLINYVATLVDCFALPCIDRESKITLSF